MGPRAYFQKRQNEDEEGDELDRQAPGVDTKCAHTKRSPVGVTGCQGVRVTGTFSIPPITQTPDDPVTLV